MWKLRSVSAILCPNVAWSRAGLHLECVGPSIIPLCKYLHKETGLLPLAKTGESIRGALFFSAIYSYDQRENEREREREREREGGRRDPAKRDRRRERRKGTDKRTRGTETRKKAETDGRGRPGGVKMKVKRSSREEEEENIREIDDVMSSRGPPGSPQITTHAQMLLNEA